MIIILDECKFFLQICVCLKIIFVIFLDGGGQGWGDLIFFLVDILDYVYFQNIVNRFGELIRQRLVSIVQGRCFWRDRWFCDIGQCFGFGNWSQQLGWIMRKIIIFGKLMRVFFWCFLRLIVFIGLCVGYILEWSGFCQEESFLIRNWGEGKGLYVFKFLWCVQVEQRRVIFF